METTSVDTLAKHGQAALTRASGLATELREGVAPNLRKASSQTRTVGRRGIDALGDMLSQARDAATVASDSIIAYTKKNPAKALAIAAVTGALLLAVAKANAMRRD
jgi:hypothetical protein